MYSTINEREYLNLLGGVLDNGYLSESRAGETYSLPSLNVTFDLRLGFPLLTTRQMFPAGVIGELAAFVRGAEDLATFKKFGCNYWDANAANWPPNKDLPKEQWQIGKSYGSLWRNFEGIDQLGDVIKNLKDDPYSRRHVVSAWHPAAKACLPSCHILFQFYVRRGQLSCHVYMRSVDLCVGLPSDILLYGVLMSLVAKDTGLTPALLTFSFGDAHIYTNHLDALTQTQFGREIYDAPKLVLAPEATTLEFLPEHVSFENYVHHPAIKYAFNA